MLHSTRRLNHETTDRIYCQRELTCIKVTSPITKKIKGRGKLSYLFKLAHWYFMSDDRSNINSVKNQAQINLNVFKIKARMVIKFIEILVGSSLWSFSLGNRSMAGITKWQWHSTDSRLGMDLKTASPLFVKDMFPLRLCISWCLGLEGLSLETSALETLKGGKLTWPTQLMKPIILNITNL